MRILDNVNKTLLFAREALLPYGDVPKKRAEGLFLRALYRALKHPTLSNDCGQRKKCKKWAKAIRGALKEAIPALREILSQDIAAIQSIDPAAKDPKVIALCYPGMEALLAYRVAHILFEKGAPLLARMLTESAHSKTGIDIHPGARIGAGCAIDHGTGIVIGETAVLGEGVTIYHGVTLGAKNPMHEKEKKRHPTIEGGVTIYANATILGGDTIISEGTVIPSGARITHSI